MSNWRVLASLVSLAAFVAGIVLLAVDKSSDPVSGMKLAGFILFVAGGGGAFGTAADRHLPPTGDGDENA